MHTVQPIYKLPQKLRKNLLNMSEFRNKHVYFFSPIHSIATELTEKNAYFI